MTKLFLATLFFFSIGNSIAQVQYSNRYTMNHLAAQFDGMLLKDSVIITSGVIADSLPRYPVKNMLGFFDLNGQLLYAKKYRGDLQKNYGTFYNSLISTKDGGFAVTAYTIDTPGMRALLMKFDSAGNTTFVREYDIGDTNNVFLSGEALIELADGFLIGGDRQVRLPPSNYNSNIHLMMLDTLGNIKWWKTYGTSSFTETDISLLALTDTAYLVGYARNKWFLGVKWESSHTHLMVIDTSGNILSQWQDPNDSTYSPFGLMKTKDGGFAYCGRFKQSQPKEYDSFTTQGSVTKLDSAFNLVWRKRFGFPHGQTLFYNLKELNDGSLIAAGAHFSFNDTTNNYSGWFVKLTANGDSIWDRKYQSITTRNSKSEIFDFELMTDGGIIACGISQDNAPLNKQQGWLIRLDSMGCLIPGCDTITATAIKESREETIGVKVYPNPASEMVYVLMKSNKPEQLLSFKIYDANGKLLLEQANPQFDITYLLNISTFSKGLYFLEVITENGDAVKRKFVKE